MELTGPKTTWKTIKNYEDKNEKKKTNFKWKENME
jgi:hypothetical protein